MKEFLLSFDIEGPMADDQVWDFVKDHLNGRIPREAFWAIVKFNDPTHQISFHTIKALDCLSFERSEVLDND